MENMFYDTAHNIPIANLSHNMHDPTIYIINNRATRRRIHGNFIISLVYLAEITPALNYISVLWRRKYRTYVRVNFSVERARV